MSSEGLNEAGPSRRTPIRSLRQPALLKIATRNDAGGLEPPAHSDAVALRLATDRKIQWRRKGERWMDRLCEGTVSPEEFKRAAKYIEHHQYIETLHERHLNNHCSYPLCPNRPKHLYSSKPRWKISKSKGEIKEKEGNEEDGFCSKLCELRSGYVESQMREGAGLRGGKWVVELLEEVRPDIGSAGSNGRYDAKMRVSMGRNGMDGRDGEEISGTTVVPAHDSSPKSTSNPNDQSLLKRSKPKVAPPAPMHEIGLDTYKRDRASLGTMGMNGTVQGGSTISSDKASPYSMSSSNGIDTGLSSAMSNTTQPSPLPKSQSAILKPTTQPLPKRPPPKPAPPVPTQPPQPQSKLDDLLANLTIIERPTFPLPPPNSAPPNPKPIIPPPKASSARASSSLIATPTKLATSLIAASRLTGPVPQLAEDSDEESELSDWEVEMDAFGGLGEDERRLFDEMREAMELMGDTSGTDRY